MAQIIRISGRAKIAKMARIIQRAKNQVKILFILISKNIPMTMRNTMISPLIKKWVSSFIIVIGGSEGVIPLVVGLEGKHIFVADPR